MPPIPRTTSSTADMAKIRHAQTDIWRNIATQPRQTAENPELQAFSELASGLL